MKHSRRYREIKEKIPNNKLYNLTEAIEFLKNNNPEKLKNIKASFSLHWVNQKMVLKTKLTLPHIIEEERKVAVIKEGLPEDILEKCKKTKEVELLTITEVRQKVESKKKSQWGFTKLILMKLIRRTIYWWKLRESIMKKLMALEMCGDIKQI